MYSIGQILNVLCTWKYWKSFTSILKYTARYAGLLWPRLFLPFGQKIEFIMLFWPILGHFWCPVVTLVTGCLSVPNFGTDGHVCPSVPILGTDGKISKISKNHFFSTKKTSSIKDWGRCYTVYGILYTKYFVVYTVYCILYTLYSILYTVYSIHNTV